MWKDATFGITEMPRQLSEELLCFGFANLDSYNPIVVLAWPVRDAGLEIGAARSAVLDFWKQSERSAILDDSICYLDEGLFR
jgi:hypothetical protein